METLGHSQISLTMDTYSHVLPGLQVEAATRMNEALGFGCRTGCQTEQEPWAEAEKSKDCSEKVVSRLGIVHDDATVALTRGVRLRRCAASARQPSRGLPSRSSRFGLTRVSEGW